MWTVYGESLVTADFTTPPRVYQPATVPNDVRLKSLRTWVVHYSSPVFTTLKMEIYSNRSGSPGSLLYTFDKQWSSSDLYQQAYGLQEIWFDFTNPVQLKGGETYHFALNCTGASMDANSHISWVKGFPDPNTNTGAIAISYASLPSIPFYLALIGAE